MCMGTVPRMLTIQQAADETGLSYGCIRKWCLEKRIVFVRSGKKYLINMDSWVIIWMENLRKEERRMQKGIVISEEIYYKMLESYDKAMKELEELRQQLEEMKHENAPA